MESDTIVDSIKKIVEIYPTFYSLYLKYMKGEKVAKELDELYKPIFSKILMPYYMEIMPNIKEIMDLIEKTHDDCEPYYIIDYIEFLCGNIYYETFLFELKKIEPTNIGIEHLNIFKYIMYVEYIKYCKYKNVIDELDLDSKFRPVMMKRKNHCVKKISLCYNIMFDNYNHNDTQREFIESCKNMIQDDFNLSIQELNGQKSFFNLTV